jgi:hypothetical protein
MIASAPSVCSRCGGQAPSVKVLPGQYNFVVVVKVATQ